MSAYAYTTVGKGLLERIADLVKRKPENQDVVFSIGPKKKLVKGVKLILKAASPIFEKEFEERWEVGLVKEGEGIPLPDLDPVAFELFIKLTNLDTWSCETLKSLNLPPNQILNLLTICTRFGMKTGKSNLEKLAQTFIRSCNKPQAVENLMGMSQENFETVLGSEDFCIEERKVFEIACRWAEKQCKELKLEETMENLRNVLGGSLFKIRFPLMSVTEFTKAMGSKKLLTMEEALQVYNFIGLEEDQKLNFDVSQFPFTTKKRNPQLQNPVLLSKSPVSTGILTLYLTKGFSIVNDPPFVCDGTEKKNFFAPMQRIELHGLGFLGPIDSDASYDVTVEIQRYDSVKNKNFLIAKKKKQIFAKKGQTICFMFDAPIVLEASSNVNGIYEYPIHFYLKGPNTASVQRTNVHKKMSHGENKFRFYWHSKQLAEIYFKKL